MAVKKPINVLSLFDGMSCGQQALKNAKIEVKNYFASEIDKFAIKITNKNFPGTIHLGDVKEVSSNHFSLPKIDLMIGGSPCQSFSQASYMSYARTGFEGKSGIFFEYVRCLEEFQPTYFLFENVKMKKQWKDKISYHLGVEPIEINSRLFLPHSRKRLYWTNIPFDTNIKQREYDVEDFFVGSGFPSTSKKNKVFVKRDIFNCITASYGKGVPSAGKPAVSQEEGLYTDNKEAHRILLPEECEKLQGLPLGYTEGVSKTQRYKMIGNGWTIPVIEHILKGMMIEK